MAHHLVTSTIKNIDNVWQVCVNGICKSHKQQWQAEVYYHQMISNPTAHVAAHALYQDEQSLSWRHNQG